jgi:mannan endo-1,4-beta-mannosidase
MVTLVHNTVACVAWRSTCAAPASLQTSPGKYDERGLKSLDFVLETARKYGLQVVLSFIDNWKYYNGVDQYLDWSTTAPKRTMASPFKDLQGDPTGAIYGTGQAGEDLKK